MLDELVQLVQVDVGPELAGQVADGKPARAQRGKKAVAGEVGHRVLVGLDTNAAIQDLADQAHCPLVGDAAGQQAMQDLVVDGGKVLDDIALKGIAVTGQII